MHVNFMNKNNFKMSILEKENYKLTRNTFYSDTSNPSARQGLFLYFSFVLPFLAVLRFRFLCIFLQIVAVFFRIGKPVDISKQYTF